MSNRSFVFPGSLLTIFIVLLFLNNFLLIAKVEQHSMEPVLRNGQYILVYKDNSNLKQGDILVFPSPDDGQLMVKRCILLPGDPIDIDGMWLKTRATDFYLSRNQIKSFIELAEVPSDSIMVIGDNQFHSRDSRDYGFISISSVLGKVITPHE